MNWKAEISRIVHWKQVAAEHDRNKALPWYLPRVAAKREDILSVESKLGVKFPDEFAEFLELANGWQGFHVLTDLFGLQELNDGKSQLVLQRPELRELLRVAGINEQHAIVIGASDLDLDVFVLVSSDSLVLPGGVIWFASEEVDRYETFADFFSAMVNYNARIAQKMVERFNGGL
jgi:hypothetical protein